VKILVTGASSFTGYWFAKSLHASGAKIVATLTGKISAYTGIRADRVTRLREHAEIVEDCPFGSNVFLDLVGRESFDALCHHAAQVTNYRSPDFDAIGALATNTANLNSILRSMSTNGLRTVIVTGSVFEQDEGIGEPPLRAFSPYGLSKGLTWQKFRFWCGALGTPLGKFVIANPFGPYEEPRFCSYLIDQWRAGKPAEVRTPSYVRDNIHVDLLALAYADFVKQMVECRKDQRIGVAGYRETQGEFARRFAEAMRPRLGLECQVILPNQSDFSEPLIRVNPDSPNHVALGWDETAAWDRLAAYYLERLSQRS
jgi:nucleoside-diphosphate-sugar epimerase